MNNARIFRVKVFVDGFLAKTFQGSYLFELCAYLLNEMLGLDWRGHHVLEVKDEYLMDLKAERVDTAKIGPILLHLKDENVNRCYNFFDFIKTVAVKRKQFVLPNFKIN